MSKLFNQKKVASNVASTGDDVQTSFTYKGFSSSNAKNGYKLYDIDLVKQDLINHFYIRKGEKLSSKNIWVKRPGNGELLADSFDKVIGLLARNDIEADEQIEAKDIIGFKEK